MKETQKTITAWADSVFGPATLEAAWERAQDEIQELHELVGDVVAGRVAPAELASELADVRITMYRVADIAGVQWDELDPLNHVVADGIESAWAIAEYWAGRLELGIQRGDLEFFRSALAEIAHHAGIDWDWAVDAKMARNRRRKWVVTGAGVGRHVKEASPAPDDRKKFQRWVSRWEEGGRD